MTRVRRLFLALCLAGALPLLFAQPASALCRDFGEETMRSSTSMVFSGTVTVLGDRKASVQVDTVWKGDVGREVTFKFQWIRSEGPKPRPGERYTVAMERGETVNNCSMWPASNEYVRNALAKTFDEPTHVYGGPMVPMVAVGGLVTLAIGIAVVWGLGRRRRRG